MNYLQVRTSLKSYISNIGTTSDAKQHPDICKNYVRNQTDNKVNVLEKRNV